MTIFGECEVCSEEVELDDIPDEDEAIFCLSHIPEEDL